MRQPAGWPKVLIVPEQALHQLLLTHCVCVTPSTVTPKYIDIKKQWFSGSLSTYHLRNRCPIDLYHQHSDPHNFFQAETRRVHLHCGDLFHFGLEG